MVQPQPDGTMHWDMSGDESGGTLRVPPELAANEVVTRLLSDNQQLRGATEVTQYLLCVKYGIFLVSMLQMTFIIMIAIVVI